MEAALRTAVEAHRRRAPEAGVHRGPRHRWHQRGFLQCRRHGCEGGCCLPASKAQGCWKASGTARRITSSSRSWPAPAAVSTAAASHQPASVRNNVDLKGLRAAALYAEDETCLCANPTRARFARCSMTSTSASPAATKPTKCFILPMSNATDSKPYRKFNQKRAGPYGPATPPAGRSRSWRLLRHCRVARDLVTHSTTARLGSGDSPPRCTQLCCD